jgi:hypothetical protein
MVKATFQRHVAHQKHRAFGTGGSSRLVMTATHIVSFSCKNILTYACTYIYVAKCLYIFIGYYYWLHR